MSDAVEVQCWRPVHNRTVSLDTDPYLRNLENLIENYNIMSQAIYKC